MTELARFFLGPGQPRGNDCEIWGDDAHHITRVLRLRPGDEIECIDTEGLLHKVEITETGDPVRGLVRETESAHYEPPLSITLFQGLAKGDKMDWVVQKAVELGAAEVVPFSSRFTVVKLADKQRETRRQRWERIAVEAAKQCGRTRLPQVSPVLGWQELVSEVKRRIGEGELVLLAYEGEEKRTLSRITAEPSAVSIVIGPEGGFAPDEAELLAEAGVEPISLGPRILRTETAGVVALSLIGYRWGDLG